jgi:ribosome-associated protein
LTQVRQLKFAPVRGGIREVTDIATRTARPKPRRKTKSPAQVLLAEAEKILDDGKAEDLVTIDLHGKSDIADYLLIATGRSQRQIMALAQHLHEGLKAAGHGKISIEGLRHGDWVLIDAGDVVVHLFKPESRAYYNLEKMWGEAFSEAVGQA